MHLTCNMNTADRTIRFLIALLLGVGAITFQNYWLFLGGVIVLATAVSRFCGLYSLLGINARLSQQNYYLSQLPRYNPSEVFVFDTVGQIVYKNEAAKTRLDHISSIRDFAHEHYREVLESSSQDTFMYAYDDKSYQVTLQGVKADGLIYCYLIDVSEVVALNDEIEYTQREIIYTMGEIGESRSQETGYHVKRVAEYSKLLAVYAGLGDIEAENLKMASPMHDIGKVAIPDAILKKPDRLTPQEFEVMKTHATLGYEMLKHSNKPILQMAAIVARDHHEKYDGTGYPRGLAGEAIHIYGRITAVADVFDALGSRRVYKEAWELPKILELFQAQSGKHFDPKLVEILFAHLDAFVAIRDKFVDKEPQ
ncbi:MAG: hypothetical protein KU37_08985 [Sulfuricurvum sp. PC08-66]|nr:MAG: hypothetical protein KU37_08985 [Sulfuricurvum sp. PC08-66]